MKNFTFSPSFLETISCKRKGNYTYIRGLSAVGARPDYLDEGDLGHVLLELYYKSLLKGNTRTIARDKAIDVASSYYVTLDLKIDQCEKMIDIFKEYVIYYQNDEWSPIRVEEPFAVPLFQDDSFTWKDGDSGVRLIVEGIIDLEVVNSNGNEMTVDHKFPSRNSEPETLEYQKPVYCMVRNRTKVVINQISRAKATKAADRFSRYQKFYEREWLEGFKNEVVVKVLRWLRHVEEEDFEPEYSLCHKKFQPCVFEPICTQKESMREKVIETNYKVSEPYNPFDKKKKLDAFLLKHGVVF